MVPHNCTKFSDNQVVPGYVLDDNDNKRKELISMCKQDKYGDSGQWRHRNSEEQVQCRKG